MTITTMDAFTSLINSRLRNVSLPCDRPLEHYLRALWGLIEREKNSKPSYELFAHFLLDGFTEPPVPFKPEWYEHREAPLVWVPQAIKPFDYVKGTILYQIADLNRLAETIAHTENLWFGVKSPNQKSTWYNFESCTYLSAALRGMTDNLKSPRSVIRNVIDLSPDWTTLAILLHMGQGYE